jgi:hypothetical protein
MARVKPERKKVIEEFAEKWLEILESLESEQFYKQLPFKTSLKMIKELLGEPQK